MIEIFKLAILILCPFINNPIVEQKPLKGKIVYTSCATVVVQIIDSSHKDLGQGKWRRTPIDKEYENVFVVNNRCSFLESKIQRDEEFAFVLIGDASKNECNRCMFYDNLPNVGLSIEPIKKKD